MAVGQDVLRNPSIVNDAIGTLTALAIAVVVFATKGNFGVAVNQKCLGAVTSAVSFGAKE
jgi:hypothetical protein